MRLSFLILSVLVAGAVNTSAQQAAETHVLAVLQSFVTSQETFDVAKMDQVLAPDYIEISPVGEVDPRAKVLGFYAPDQKPANATVPHLTLDELNTRLFGETAVTIARVRFTPPGASAPAGAGMRVVFVLRSTAGQWRIVSSQYTPIRLKP